MQINSSLYHARLVKYIRKNLFDLLQNATNNNIFAEYALYHIGEVSLKSKNPVFHRRVIISIVEVLQIHQKGTNQIFNLLSNSNAKNFLFNSLKETNNFILALKSCQCFSLDEFDLNFSQLEKIFFLAHALDFDSDLKTALLPRLTDFDILNQSISTDIQSYESRLLFLGTFQLDKVYNSKLIPPKYSAQIADWVIKTMLLYESNVELALTILKEGALHPEILYQTQIRFALGELRDSFHQSYSIAVFSRLFITKEQIS